MRLYYYLGISAIIFICIIFYTTSVYGEDTESPFSEGETPPLYDGEDLTKNPVPNKQAIEVIPLEALSAIIMNAQTGEVLYEKNSHILLPLASITKLASIAVINTHLSPGRTVSITKDDLKTEGESGLIPGTVWSVNELSKFSLLTSSNDGIAALARTVEEEVHNSLEDGDVPYTFVDLMNDFAHTRGFAQLSFLNPTGLDESKTLAGAYGSAYDVASLTQYFFNTYKELSAATVIQTSEFFSHDGGIVTGTNTNISIGELPFVAFSKTGFTDLAGGNLTVVVTTDVTVPFIVVVLGSTQSGRFEDVEKLTTALNTYWRGTLPSSFENSVYFE